MKILQLSYNPGMLVHICPPSTQESEGGGLLKIWEQVGVQSEFTASLNYVASPCPHKLNNYQET